LTAWNSKKGDKSFNSTDKHVCIDIIVQSKIANKIFIQLLFRRLMVNLVLMFIQINLCLTYKHMFKIN